MASVWQDYNLRVHVTSSCLHLQAIMHHAASGACFGRSRFPNLQRKALAKLTRGLRKHAPDHLLERTEIFEEDGRLLSVLYMFICPV